jgi:endonuclease/exonuclease/phosphatase family metal-dependent hydrolase
MTLRVMTWNLWWRFGPWEQRLPAIAAVLASEQPDVLLAQEVWGTADDSSAHRLAEPLGYHVALTDDPFGGRAVGFHNAVISRYPVLSTISHPLPGPHTEVGHRRILSVVLDTPWGPWPMMSTHFDYRFGDSGLRIRQSHRLLELVGAERGDPDTSLPVVVGGDFNAVPDSDEIRVLRGLSPGPVGNLVLSDCWEQVGDGQGATWRRDNPHQTDTAWPDRRLDYVFVSWPRPKPVGNPSGAWLSGTTPVAGVTPSDHAAVVVELQTPDVGLQTS